MDDLRRRFTSLDQVRAPDLWDTIERRAAETGSVARVTTVTTPSASLRRRVDRPLVLVLAAAAVLLALVAAGIAVGSRRAVLPTAAANGWVAFTVEERDPADIFRRDRDIWFTALGQEARRIVGTDTDHVDQRCPAFSPDGRRLAYGSGESDRSPANSLEWPDVYRNAALVVADVKGDGTVADPRTYDIGDGVPAPCPVWSPDGERIAFGVPRTSPINPDRSGAGSEVWVLRPSDGTTSVIKDILATDLDWSPDGRVLAITGGFETASGAGVVDGVQDSRIHLYELSSGSLRTLDETLGAGGLTWSPDGRRIAFERQFGGDPPRVALRIIDVETGRQEVLTDEYQVIHGIGPVWSPDGKTIAYQRSTGGEFHVVALVTPGSRSEQTGFATEVTLPTDRRTADGSNLDLHPWRVSWSPDGHYLLYVAWTNMYEGDERTVVAAVPTDPDAPASILANVDGIDNYDADDAMRVLTQVWGRR